VDQILPIPSDTLSLALPAAHEIDAKGEQRPSQDCPSTSCQKRDRSGPSCPGQERPTALPTPARTAPCKLISRLVENPSTDITQVPLDDYEADKSAPTDGVECSKAYKLLMQFATTEEKLDTISRALEDGCTGNEGPRSGCRVRNEMIWKAIDDLS
jgi:hypothetical protein